MKRITILIVSCLVIQGLSISSSVLSEDTTPQAMINETDDMGSDPTSSGRDIQLGWEDHYLDFSKTIYKGSTLYISNEKVLVGLANFTMESDEDTVLLYHFNNGSGDTLIDSGPNSKNGTLKNMDPSTDWVPGVNGTALDFDGNNDFVQVPSSPVFNIEPNITVEAWIYPRQIQPFSDKNVLAKRSGYSLWDSEFMIDTPTVKYARKKIVPVNKWTYLAGSYDGANVRLFVDGKLAASTASPVGMSHQTNNLYIGNSASYYFDGMIDEIRISDIARSAEEINATWLDNEAGKNGYLTPMSHILTENMTILPNRYWHEINVVKETPVNTSIKITVVDNITGDPIPGFETLDGDTINISTINPMIHPSIQLKVHFYVVNDTVSPKLDYLNVTWTNNNEPPKVHGVECDGFVTKPGTIPISINVSDADQFPDALLVEVEAKHIDQGTWTKSLLTNLHFNASTGFWVIDFQAGASADVGPYNIRVTVIDEMDASDTRTFENVVIVYTREGGSIEILEKGLEILRGSKDSLTIVPHLDGPTSETDVHVMVWRGTEEMGWFEGPYVKSDQFVIDVSPPLDSELGGYDVQAIALNKQSYKYVDTIVEDAFIVKNNLPYWNRSEPLTMYEDSKESFDLLENVVDIDTDLLDISFELVGYSNEENHTLAVTWTMLDVVALEVDWSGPFNVTLRLSDTIDEVDINITVLVEDIPDAPVIDQIPDLVEYEDRTLYHNFSVYDPDPGSVLDFALDIGPETSMMEQIEGYSFNEKTGELVLPLTNDLVGRHSSLLQVSDGLHTVSQPFILIVKNVNDEPIWEKVPSDTVVLMGDTYTFVVKATDIDKGDFLFYDISSMPVTSIPMDENTGAITWTPDIIGIYFLNVSARDAVSEIYHEFKIEVRRPGTNNLPVAMLMAPENGTNVGLVNPLFEWSIEDMDGHNVTSDIYIGTDLARMRHLDTEYLVGHDLSDDRFIPLEILEQGELYYWTVIPKDQYGYGDCESDIWYFTVASNARVNHKPVITPLALTTVYAGETVKLDLEAEDDDLDLLTYSLVSGPPGVEISDSGQILWKTKNKDVGVHEIVFTVSDGRYIVGSSVKVSVKKVPETLDSYLYGILALMIIIAVVAVVALLIMKKRKKGKGEEMGQMDHEPPGRQESYQSVDQSSLPPPPDGSSYLEQAGSGQPPLGPHR